MNPSSLSSSVCAIMAPFLGCFISMASVWAAAMVGVLIGWIWKPRWATSVLSAVMMKPCDLWSSSAVIRAPWSTAAPSKTKAHCEDCSSLRPMPPKQMRDVSHLDRCIVRKSFVTSNFASSAVGEQDLCDLHRRLHGRDGGLSWDMMMERSAPGMFYQAWRRDPQDGPTQYKSRTIFEDSTPGLVKDFYWDDDFRSVWDDMLISSKTLEECADTGADIAQWVRKFPFFCSDREYIIGRRIFEVDGTFYCITKAVPYNAIPRREKPLRVDIYYSSWCIRGAESVKNKGQMTACEVIFFHAEDMHIPKKIAKIGVRQGMWGCVRKMEPGLRKYKVHRSIAKMLSQSARLAQLYTRMPPKFFGLSELVFEDTESQNVHAIVPQEAAKSGLACEGQLNGCWKWVIVGGAVVLACTLDRGVLGRTLVFGLARKFGRFSQRLP